MNGGSDAGRDGAATLMAAGLDVIATVGYGAASIRDIARAAGMSTANLYHHFSSKEELLFRVMVDSLDVLRATTDEALGAVGEDPVARYRALVWTHSVVHARTGVIASVSASEIRHLTPDHQHEMRAKMRRQQRAWDETVLDGVARGVFHLERPLDGARAVASMCTAVATWYREGGTLTPEALGDLYVDLALAMVGVRSA